MSEAGYSTSNLAILERRVMKVFKKSMNDPIKKEEADVKAIATGVSDVHLTNSDSMAPAPPKPLTARPVKLNRNRSLSSLGDSETPTTVRAKSASTPSSPLRSAFSNDMAGVERASAWPASESGENGAKGVKAEDVDMTDADDARGQPRQDGVTENGDGPRRGSSSVVTIVTTFTETKTERVTKRTLPRLSIPATRDVEEDMVDIEGDSPLTSSEPMSLSSSASATPANSAASPTDTRFPPATTKQEQQSSRASSPVSSSLSPTKTASKKLSSNSSATPSHPLTRQASSRRSQPPPPASPRDIPVRIASPQPVRRRNGTQLWDYLSCATDDAKRTYTHIEENQYRGSATGKSIAEESMPCECSYERKADPPEAACGDDSVCINRMMFIECTEDDCPSGPYCMNRRFQLRQWAQVDVIKTEKKGYGLRALANLASNDFIMEYIGEVIPNVEFVKRTKDYEAEGLEHFYFMTLKSDEIIDATKKGCLARFMNHSCNPNCVTQKWVVGKKMRIGIFTTRSVEAGEELTFDYKFERFGATAQNCYCGEVNCKGIIGGLKNGNKVEVDEDEEDDDDSAGSAPSTPKAKKREPIKPKNIALRTPEEVPPFVKMMLDSVGKPRLVHKLVQRLLFTESKDVLRSFLRLHGLKMLKFWLLEWAMDMEIVQKVLVVLQQLPLTNRNALEDCKMFDVVQKFMDSEDEEVVERAKDLLEEWGQLKSMYRIPKRAYSEQKDAAKQDGSQSPTVKSMIKRPSDDGVMVVQEKRTRFESSRDFYESSRDYYDSYRPTPVILLNRFTFTPPPAAPRAMLNGFFHPAPLTTSPLPSPVSANGSALDGQTLTPTHTPLIGASHNPFAPPPVPSPMVPQQPQQPQQPLMPRPVAQPHVPPAPMPMPMMHQVVIPPKQLPPNWKTALCEDGTVYYYNSITGKSQWDFPIPPEKASSIEGVDQMQIDGLVEKAMVEGKRRKDSESSGIGSGKGGGAAFAGGSGGADGEVGLTEMELKKEVGKCVTKHLSGKHKTLCGEDKEMFKELARKITHHIVDKETQASRSIKRINTAMRHKIEKFIDEHGPRMANKLRQRRRGASDGVAEGGGANGSGSGGTGSAGGDSARTPGSFGEAANEMISPVDAVGYGGLPNGVGVGYYTNGGGGGWVDKVNMNNRFKEIAGVEGPGLVRSLSRDSMMESPSGAADEVDLVQIRGVH